MLPTYLDVQISSSTGVLHEQRCLEVDPTHTVQEILEYLDQTRLLLCPIGEITVKNSGVQVMLRNRLHQLKCQHSSVLKLMLDASKIINPSSMLSPPHMSACRPPEYSGLQPSEALQVVLISSTSSNILERWLFVRLQASLTIEKLLIKLHQEGKLKLPVDQVTVLKDGMPIPLRIQLCMLPPQPGTSIIGLIIQARKVEVKPIPLAEQTPRTFQPIIRPREQRNSQHIQRPTSKQFNGKATAQNLIESNTTAATVYKSSAKVGVPTLNFDNFLSSRLGSKPPVNISTRKSLVRPQPSRRRRGSHILERQQAHQQNPQLLERETSKLRLEGYQPGENRWQTIRVEEDHIKFIPVQFSEETPLDINSPKLIENVFEIVKNPTPSKVQRLVECWDQSLSQINHKESEQFETQLLSSKSEILGCSPVLLLGKALSTARKTKVSYSKFRTPASRFTMLHLTTRLGEGWGKGEYKYEDNSDFSFDNIANSEEKLDMFVDLFKKDMAKHYSTIPERIIVTQIVKGSINVKFYYEAGVRDGSDPYSRSDIPHLKGRKLVKEELLFSELQLSEEDFNSDGDINFVDQYKAQEYVRGLFPYYQPAGWIRYGLNVQKYGDQSWLGMQNLPGEWAVMYHGVQSPKNILLGTNIQMETTVAKAIVDNNLKPGVRQLMEGYPLFITQSHLRAFQQFGAFDEERTGNLGKGVYGTPLIQTAGEFTSQFEVNGQAYLLAFQCRVRPDKIRFTASQPDYWLVNEPEYIRPYGILLTKPAIVAREEHQAIQNRFSANYKRWLEGEGSALTEQSDGDF